MFKILITRYGIGILLNILLVIVVGILHAIILNLIPISINSLTIFCYVFGGVISVIATSVVLKFFWSFIIFDNNSDFGNFEGDFKFWKKRLEDGKPVKCIVMQLFILPILAISVTLILIMVFMYSSFNSMIAQFIAEQNGSVNSSHCALQVFPATILSASAVLWLIYYFCIVSHYIKATCPQCGNLYSYCEGNDVAGSYYSREETQHKYKDRYGKVGELYLDDKKIGDVRGKTGTDTYERKIKSFGHDVHAQCKYCGRKTKIYHGACIISDWK